MQHDEFLIWQEQQDERRAGIHAALTDQPRYANMTDDWYDGYDYVAGPEIECGIRPAQFPIEVAVASNFQPVM